jgi:predicted HD phosphohydrolase
MLNFIEWISMQENHLHDRFGKKTVNRFRDALSFMPQSKIDHSLRVGKTVSKSGLDDDAVHAAILHDYIERGGDVFKLKDLGISDQAMRVIQMLSVDEKNSGVEDNMQVYDHMQQVLDDLSIDLHSKNIAIIIKASDRMDNLQKRIKAHKLSSSYYLASKRLFSLLFSRYTGEKSILNHISNKLRKLEKEISVKQPNVFKGTA